MSETKPENILEFVGTYEQLINLVKTKPGLVVLDIHWVWCGPCRKLIENLPQIATENPDVTFIKIDHEKSPEVTEKYEVQMFPTIVFMKNAEVKEIHIGANVRDFKEKIEKYKKE